MARRHRIFGKAVRFTARMGVASAKLTMWIVVCLVLYSQWLQGAVCRENQSREES